MSNKQTTTQTPLGIRSVKTIVDERLDAFFDHKIAEGRDLGSPYETLTQRMKDFTLRGGKRLRPYLCYLGYLAGGGKEMPPVDVLCAIELFHNSLLIHDDIMDRDLTRYGGPNIAGIYIDDFSVDASHLATSAAILAGDLGMALSQDLVLSTGLSPDDKQFVLSSLAHQYKQVIAGQLMDTLVDPSRPPQPEDISNIQLNKTAAYTTIGPLQIGARLSHASEELSDKLTQYGKNLGQLFQTTDDLLGTFGNEAATGKPSCTDLHENKPTMLFCYARQLCKESDLRLLNTMLGKPHKQGEDISSIRLLLDRCGAKERTEKLAITYAENAIATLDGLNGEAFDDLRTVATNLVHRIA